MLAVTRWRVTILSFGCEQEQCEALHEERDGLISQLHQLRGGTHQVCRHPINHPTDGQRTESLI